MKWLDALRIFNRDNPGKWCIPKTGTPEHQTVLDIMNGKHMRRQEKIQGSGLFDVFGKLYNMDKAKKDKKAARVRQIQDEYRALKAAEKAAAAAPVVASTPVVGSGKRRGRPKGSKNKGIKGGHIFDEIRHSFASIGNTMDNINPIIQSHKALHKALNVKVT